MRGQLQQDAMVGVSATTMWEVFGTIRLTNLVRQLVPTVMVDVEQGDGGVGTVLKITNLNENGEPSASYIKEKYVLIDNEKRIKVAQHLEGEYINAGFDYFRTRLEILEKGREECIIRCTIEYEIDDERIEDATQASIKFLRAANAVTHLIGNHVIRQK